MKIEWLDDALSEAIITRGFWWWKRRAHVRDNSGDWHYVPSGEWVGSLLSVELRSRQAAKQERRQAIGLKLRNWDRVRALPSARIARKS